MKSLVLQNSKAWLEDVPDLVPDREWVVVKIESTPICGSDRKAFLSEKPVRSAGHEGSGTVTAVRGSSLLREGDRVILNPLSGCGSCSLCRSGNYIYCRSKPPFGTHFAEYVLVQDFVCTPLPDDISFDVGSLACCALGPAFSSSKRMNLSGYDTVLITGLGPVGLGAVTIAKFLGARVIALDTIAFRRNLALEIGADIVLDPADPEIRQKILAAKGKDPLRKAIEASGNPQAQRLCLDMAEPCGFVAFIGENSNQIPIGPSDDFIRKGLTLFGSWHLNLNDREDIYAILRHSPTIEKLISETYPLREAQKAFEHFMQADTCKVLLKPWA